MILTTRNTEKNLFKTRCKHYTVRAISFETKVIINVTKKFKK